MYTKLNNEYKDKQDKVRRDIKSIEYFADWTRTNEEICDDYLYTSKDDYRQDITLIKDDIEMKYEVKTCNADYNERSMIAEDCYYLHWDKTPTTIPTTDKECKRLEYEYDCNEYKPSNENEIPQHIKGKNLYITLNASDARGRVMSEWTKAYKMLVEGWGLVIEFRNGIKIFRPEEFKDAALGFCWIYTEMNKAQAEFRYKGKDWKLMLAIDLNKGNFYEGKTPENVFNKWVN